MRFKCVRVVCGRFQVMQGRSFRNGGLSWVDGIEIGKQELLKSKVEKKWKKGKTIEQIADDLEEEVIIIQRIIEALRKKKEEK